jgi:glycosyltransferase involved in cell wall biosynthesis
MTVDSDKPSPPTTDSDDAGLDWTIIVPAYNEEERLGPTLRTIQSYLRERASRFESIVVDDGSTDGTADLVRREFPDARLLSNPGNRGKGYSVRAGLLAARGRWVLFSDADLSTPIEELARFEEELRAGADVVIASRALAESVIEAHQAWWREFSGRSFNILVQVFSGLPFHDTQCGFKAYRREAARRIASLQRLEGWAFDIEQLRLARLMGMRVKELPVRWINSSASRVRFLRDAPRMFLDAMRVRLMRYDL